MAIFSNMESSDNKYLHNIDLKSLSKETGLNYKELAQLAKIGPKVVYKWHYSHNDSSRPDYNALVRLLQLGATTETLFGVTCKPRHDAPAVPSPDFIAAHPDLLEGFQEQLIADLKKRGIFSEDNIRDIVRQEIDRLLPGKTDPKI